MGNTAQSAASLRDSLIALGGGNDSVSIVSGFRGGLGIIGLAGSAKTDPLANTLSRGLQIDLQDQASRLAAEDWSLRLSATAIGLQDSLVSTGAGNGCGND